MKHPTRLVVISTLCCLLLTTTTVEAQERGKRPLEWYVKTVVEVTHPVSGLMIRDTRSGIFGQLVASKPGWDPHDIPAFGATQSSKAAVVFIHGEDWGDRAGEYLSDYHGAGNRQDAWEFTVHSALAPGQVTLRWEGLFEVKSTEVDGLVSFTKVRVDDHDQLKSLHLVDLTTGRVIDVFIQGKGTKPDQWTRSYTFDMGGATRRDFRWVLGDLRKQNLLPGAPSGKSGKLSSLQIQQRDAAQHGRPKDN